MLRFHLTVYVIMSTHLIASLEKVMHIDERSYNYNASYNSPKPVIRRAEVGIYASSSELVADSV